MFRLALSRFRPHFARQNGVAEHARGRDGASDQRFYAPEVFGPAPEGGFKDGGESIRKQVRRVRVYASDDQDRVIGAVAGDGGTWSAHHQ
ncbi:LodA/GoxA family CTQ-dependent oxidase [Roseovarius dicentrarchi]|uniref:LodA/GoxA family CTQ-dependent oxidase n=1 Tax=Roseovarius dicentrarchi TaxID=2250573 RepID=UPI000DE93859|nr:LodA/GoxA family CTQ-dependent oxidase [Roseovarius dicentrarchi]